DAEVDAWGVTAAEEVGEITLMVVRENGDRPEIAAIGTKLPFVELELRDRDAGVILKETLGTLQQMCANVGERTDVHEVGRALDERITRLQLLAEGLEAASAPAAIGEVSAYVEERSLLS